MVFALGDLLVLGVVLIVICIFRYIDRGNRSLEKVRNFVDRAGENLARIAEDKAQQLKDLAINVEIHQQSAMKAIEQIEISAEELGKRTSYIEEIQSRINQYDLALRQLVDMTNQAERNIKGIQDESAYVDTVGRRIKESRKHIESLEKSVSEIINDFSARNNQQLEKIRESVFKTGKETALELEQKVESAGNRAQKLLAAFQTDAENTQQRITGSVETAQTKIQEITETMQTDAADIQDTIQNLADTTIKSVDNSFSEYKRDFENVEISFREGLNRVAEKARKFEFESFEILQAELETKRANVSEQFKNKMDEQEQDFQEQFIDYTRKSKEQYEQISDSLKEHTEVHRRNLNELETEMQNSIEVLKANYTTKHEEIQVSISEKASGMEKRILGDLEQNLIDYEGSITHRLSRLDEVGKQLDGLEQVLQKNMEHVSAKLESEAQSVGERVRKKYDEDITRLRGDLDEISGHVTAQRNEIDTLREESRSNIIEQLEAFEREFFTDLQERRKNLDARLEKWTESFDGALEELRSDTEGERSLLEKKYLEDIGTGMDALRSGMTDRFSELQTDFQERESVIHENLNILTERINNGQSAVDEHLERARQQSMNTLNSRCQEIQNTIADRMKNMQDDMEGNLRNMDELILKQENEITVLQDGIRSDVSAWQNTIHQQLKTDKDDIESEMAAFRIRINDVLLAIKEEYNEEKTGILAEERTLKDKLFTQLADNKSSMEKEVDVFRAKFSDTLNSLQAEYNNEKNDIIAGAVEARKQLQSDIRNASEKLTALRSELEEKKETALERFNLDYTSFMQDFLKQKDDASREFSASIRDFREFVGATRKEFEGTQKRLIGGLTEEIKTVELNIREIEKKQKSFLQQTKLFDRADTLKQGLIEDINALRNEVNKFQSERKQIGEYENEFLRIQKLGKEAHEKMLHFSVEQRKLENVEESYKRIMALSGKLDKRLESVNLKHDNVQQMQLAIRNLSDLQKELDQRYDRLSKRREVIDATLEGVDRNFQQLTDLDTRIGGIHKSMGTVSNEIAVLKGRLDSLSVNKKESDMAMRNLQNLNQLMESVETRAGEMNKAREWLARIETRMEDITRQADKQMEILGALTKKSRSDGNDEGPALSVSERDMVIKLKHQGWNVEDIAKTCKISRGEVELILEMTHG